MYYWSKEGLSRNIKAKPAKSIQRVQVLPVLPVSDRAFTECNNCPSSNLDGDLGP